MRARTLAGFVPAKPRLFGILMVAGASLLWSTAGFFVRLIDLDVWTLVGWRSLLSVLSLAAVAAVMKGRAGFDLRRGLGWRGMIYVPFAVVGMLGFIVSLRLTSVANVMVIYATIPLVGAGIAWLVLGERVERPVLLASVAAFLGVLVMASSETGGEGLAGNAVALLMTVAFATTVVMARAWPELDLILATAAASAACAVICFALSPGGMPGPGTLGLIFLFSVATQSLSYVMFLVGGRHIRASEAGLVALVDVVLAPLWVWIAFGEQPAAAAIVGGAMVLAAVCLCLGWQLRRERRRRRPLRAC